MGCYPFSSYVKNKYIFAKFKIESSRVGGDRGIFGSIYSADRLGFAAAL